VASERLGQAPPRRGRAVRRGGRPQLGQGCAYGIASLSALAGLFAVLGSRSGDRHLFLAGFRARSLLAARLSVISLGALTATAASLAVTAALFDLRQWGLYLAANTLIALTYGLLGVLIGTVFGRVGGVFTAFLVPFLDLGLEQSPMLNPEVSGLGHALPGYGATRVLYDAALTPTFDETGPLLISLAWLAALALAAGLLFRRAPCASRSQAGGAPQRKPAAQVPFDPQIVLDHSLDLELQRTVALVAGQRSERVEAAAFVEVHQGKGAQFGVVEGDQGAQELRAEPAVLQGAVHRVEVVDQSGQVAGVTAREQP
jgi:hypothetical protein